MVIGGEVSALEGVELANLDNVDFVGLYPNYDKAYEAWNAKAHSTVDNAHMRYFVVHLHRLIDPDHEDKK